MEFLRYRDTRGLDPSRPAFTDVILTGTAKGGGLHVPESLPSLPLPEILALASEPYHRRVARVLEIFRPDIPQERIDAATAAAFSGTFDDPAVTPLREIEPGLHILEEWHGPTAAFKDLALQCLPRLIAESLGIREAAGSEIDDLLIVVATSGDTGSAALAGFADTPRCRVVVFYPEEGISGTQREQILHHRGDSSAVVGVSGSFDDCQGLVKSMFDDEEWSDYLRDRHHLRLSSANSINWGRIPIQIASWASAYADLAARGGVRPGDPVDICVPTGNFGNVLAAWYAGKIGVPFGRLICASNENDALTRFLDTGIWDIRKRELIGTPSPSMDILVSSNLERLLFEVCGDGSRVREWAHDLAATGAFEVDRETMAAIGEIFTGDSVSNDDCLGTIRQMHLETGYLFDPHTAVAWEVGHRQRGRAPLIVVSTAHWAKFGEDIYRALNGIGFRDPLPDRAADLSRAGLLEEITRLAPGERIPASITALDLPAREPPLPIGATKDAAAGAIEAWLDRSGSG
ncbi:threonine synthase [Gemmatimonadota bacterium]